MPDDAELLRRYADTRAEDAFAELVRRRIGLVYSVALRHTRDAHRAEDVCQRVFVDLARKASALGRRPVLIGWLYRSAQFAASDTVRAERRRQVREQETHIMQTISDAAPEPDWEKLRPVLDEVLNAMSEPDRDAILLRFFDALPFVQIGERLRLSENAARMRVDRALEKLRTALARRGVTSTAAALGLVLGHGAGATAPAGLAGSVAAAAVAGAKAAGMAAFGLTKIPTVIAGALAVAGALLFFWQQRTSTELAGEIRNLQAQVAEISTLAAENRRLARVAAEVAALRLDALELAQLEKEIRLLKQQWAARKTETPPPDTAPRMAIVNGKVGRPGRFELPPAGPMTLQEFITRAGGFTENAKSDSVKVLRTMANRELKTFVLDAAVSGAFVIEANDAVYVPERLVQNPGGVSAEAAKP